MNQLLICLPLTTMIICPWGMVGKGLLSGIPLGSLEKLNHLIIESNYFFSSLAIYLLYLQLLSIEYSIFKSDLLVSNR